MGSAIGEFCCCPQMFCKRVCEPAAWTWMSFFFLRFGRFALGTVLTIAWTWMSTQTVFFSCVPSSSCYCRGPFMAAMFVPLFWTLFRGHEKACLICWQAYFQFCCWPRKFCKQILREHECWLNTCLFLLIGLHLGSVLGSRFGPKSGVSHRRILLLTAEVLQADFVLM